MINQLFYTDSMKKYLSVNTAICVCFVKFLGFV